MAFRVGWRSYFRIQSLPILEALYAMRFQHREPAASSSPPVRRQRLDALGQISGAATRS
jgi:hypothetical protein